MRDHSDNNGSRLIAFRNGEEQGFNWFFRSMYPALCLFISRYIHSLPVSEEIASDCFIKVWAKREGFTSAQALKSYLYRTAYHASLRWLQQSKRTLKPGVMDIVLLQAEEKNYLENITRVETLREVQAAISLLPAACRKIFTKIYVEGKSVKETAEELMLSVSTVKSQKSRGLFLIREKLSAGFVILFSGLLLFF
jgi:RNA polymerase sigma-70 factor (family 1)